MRGPILHGLRPGFLRGRIRQPHQVYIRGGEVSGSAVQGERKGWSWKGREKATGVVRGNLIQPRHRHVRLWGVERLEMWIVRKLMICDFLSFYVASEAISLGGKGEPQGSWVVGEDCRLPQHSKKENKIRGLWR